MKNKKGFTLIELLAVVVLLGVILAIAIPGVTSYITNSRKNTFISSAKGYIDAAKVYMADKNGARYPIGLGTSVVVPITELDASGNIKEDAFGSPFVLNDCYVTVVNVNRGYDFYITLLDEEGNALDYVHENDLKVDRIEYNAGRNKRIEVYLGDVDHNGSVDILDISMIKNFYLGLNTLNEIQKTVADTNDDGVLNADDIPYITDLLLGNYSERTITIDYYLDGARDYILNESTLNEKGLYKVLY